MHHVTLIVSAVLATAAAAVFALVGRSVLSWRPAPSERLARDAFAVWWIGLAAITASGAFQHALAAAGYVSLPLYLSLLHIGFLGIFVALCGLMYYLLYVYTGSRRIGVPLMVFYAAFYLWVLYLIALSQPVGIHTEPWRVRVEYANQVTGPEIYAFLALLLVPILVGTALYSLLWFRVSDPTQKRRVAMVSGAFLVWFGSAAFAAFVTIPQWPLVSRLIGLAAALVILWAFRRADPAAHGAQPTDPPVPVSQ